MTLKELKRCAHYSRPEVHVLANEGDVYLVQIFHDGMQSLLMENNQPKRFRSLAECSHQIAMLGVQHGYMIQSMPNVSDQYRNLAKDYLRHELSSF